MNALVLSVITLTAVALGGMAAWTWHTLDTVGDGLGDFAGFDVVRVDDVQGLHRTAP